MKLTGINELKDKHLGEVGSAIRDKYEQALKIKFLAEEIKALRLANDLTQDKLGELVGAQRTQISKIENGKTNITIGTLVKVFNALKARINFSVESEL